jgi:hypothetical protein
LVAVLAPFMTVAELATKVATAAIGLVIGMAIGSLVSGALVGARGDEVAGSLGAIRAERLEHAGGGWAQHGRWLGQLRNGAV